MGRKRSRLTEQRLVPFEAAWHVAYPKDRPYTFHRIFRRRPCRDYVQGLYELRVRRELTLDDLKEFLRDREFARKLRVELRP